LKNPTAATSEAEFQELWFTGAEIYYQVAITPTKWFIQEFYPERSNATQILILVLFSYNFQSK
jgi:hypothetical protein